MCVCVFVFGVDWISSWFNCCFLAVSKCCFSLVTLFACRKFRNHCKRKCHDWLTMNFAQESWNSRTVNQPTWPTNSRLIWYISQNVDASDPLIIYQKPPKEKRFHQESWLTCLILTILVAEPVSWWWYGPWSLPRGLQLVPTSIWKHYVIYPSSWMLRHGSLEVVQLACAPEESQKKLFLHLISSILLTRLQCFHWTDNMK